jgi:2-dehydro-3-deoxygluconokinase
VIYDRAGASIESLSMDEVDFSTIESSRIFHFSGITPALSESCRETVAGVVQRALRAGVKVSCDVNYRSKLWPAEEACEVISALIGDLDLLLIGQGDLETLWKRSGDAEDELRRLQDEFRIADVVMTRGQGGAIGLIGNRIYEQEAFTSEVVSPIGAGDAFAAGVLYSLLNEEPALSLKRGCAMAALARESRSDYVLSGIEALEEKMSSGGGSGKRLSR